MQRRELFQILGASLVQAEPRQLNADQRKTLDRALTILLPPDGAIATPTIEAMLLKSPDPQRDAWHDWLKSIDKIHQLNEQQATDWFAKLDDEQDRAFAIFKRAAIDAYYPSEAGKKELGYHGDTAVHHFAGCTHPEHKS